MRNRPRYGHLVTGKFLRAQEGNSCAMLAGNVGYLSVIGGNNDAVKQSTITGSAYAVGDYRTPAKNTDVLSRYPLTPTPGGYYRYAM